MSCAASCSASWLQEGAAGGSWLPAAIIAERENQETCLKCLVLALCCPHFLNVTIWVIGQRINQLAGNLSTSNFSGLRCWLRGEMIPSPLALLPSSSAVCPAAPWRRYISSQTTPSVTGNCHHSRFLPKKVPSLFVPLIKRKGADLFDRIQVAGLHNSSKIVTRNNSLEIIQFDNEAINNMMSIMTLIWTYEWSKYEGKFNIWLSLTMKPEPYTGSVVQLKACSSSPVSPICSMKGLPPHLRNVRSVICQQILILPLSLVTTESRRVEWVSSELLASLALSAPPLPRPEEIQTNEIVIDLTLWTVMIRDSN